MAYIEFKTEANAKKPWGKKQRTEIDRLFIFLCYTGEKDQIQDHRDGKNST